MINAFALAALFTAGPILAVGVIAYFLCKSSTRTGLSWVVTLRYDDGTQEESYCLGDNKSEAVDDFNYRHARGCYTRVRGTDGFVEIKRVKSYLIDRPTPLGEKQC